jgi:hypothetical protein
MAECLDPSAPGDEELLRSAEGEELLPEEKRTHLDQCAVCQQRLAEYTRLDEALVGRFYRRFCPSGIQISLYCEGLIPDEALHSIAKHILSCPLCSTEVADTRRFMRNVPAVAETVFSPLGSIRRVIGTLTRQQAQVVMHFREGDDTPESAWPRQYRADDIDLSLHLSRTTSGEQILLGILSGVNSAERADIFEGAEAELYAGSALDDIKRQTLPTPIRRTQVDDLGNLIFYNVPYGKYTLVIHLPDHEVTIEQVNIEQHQEDTPS